MIIDTDKLKLLATNVQDFKIAVEARIVSKLNELGHLINDGGKHQWWDYSFTSSIEPNLRTDHTFYCERCPVEIVITWHYKHISGSFISSATPATYEELCDFTIHPEGNLHTTCSDIDKNRSNL